jgi:uncharacterized protein YkwD/uncharacterized membrane protein required for colicin V production
MSYVDLIIIVIVLYSAFIGLKRGWLLAGLEFLSFSAATALSLFTYRFLGPTIQSAANISLSLGNVAAFVVIWIIAEIACAVIVRYWVLPHVPRQVNLSRLSRAGGAFLSAAKSVVMVALLLVVYTSLPLAADTKHTVTQSAIPSGFLASSGWLESAVGASLGRDIGESLNFFTVTAEPESEQRIALGYTTTGSVDAKDEAEMLVLINRERTSRGLNALTMNDKARAVALIYSTDMFARGYFSHVSLDGKTPFDRMHDGNVEFGSAGENLALAPTLKLAHQGLMNSPGHRANILNYRYRTVGIGIIDGGPYGLMITQDFTD